MNTVSISALLGALTSGFNATEAAVISAVASFSATNLVKLAIEELQQVSTSLKTFVSSLRNGMSWGEAMANMLTTVWNNTKTELAQLATDFVEAVGKVFENAGLLFPQGASA